MSPAHLAREMGEQMESYTESYDETYLEPYTETYTAVVGTEPWLIFSTRKVTETRTRERTREKTRKRTRTKTRAVKVGDFLMQIKLKCFCIVAKALLLNHVHFPAASEQLQPIFSLSFPLPPSRLPFLLCSSTNILFAPLHA